MKRWKQWFYKLREKYLFTFLLTLLLPCVVVVAFVQSTYIRQIDENILSTAQERSKLIQQEFDRVFEDMRTVTDIVMLDTDLVAIPSPQEYSKVKAIQERLEVLIMSQRCIGNVFVLKEDSDYLISAMGTYQKDAFCSAYTPSGMTQNQFWELIQSGNTGMLSITSSKDEYWMVRASFIQKRQNIYLLFFINRTELQKLLTRHLTDGVGVLYVQNYDGDVLAFYTNDSDYTETRYDQILSLSNYENGIVSIDGDRYVLARSGFSENGWETVSMVTRDTLSLHAQAQNNIWILMLVIVLLVGILMVIYLSNAMYKPIHSIKSKVEEMYSDLAVQQKPNTSAYETISAGIDYLQQQRLDMRSQIENHHQYLVGRLLKNGLSTGEDLEQLYTAFNWDRNRDVFYIGLIYANAGYTRDELVETIQTVQMRQIRFLVKEMYQEGTFALIWIVPKENCATIEEQMEMLRTSESNILRIFCSSQWCSLEGIPETFIKVIVSTSGREIDLPEDHCRQLRSAMTNKNWIKAARILDSIMPLVKNSDCLRFLCLSVAVALSGEAIPGCQEDIFELARVNDGYLYDKYIKNVCAFIHENANRYEKNKEPEATLITKMVRYLNVKYNDPTFSIQEMADEFGMSMPALSKYFHEKHGVPLNEYTAQLKMDRAKFLLENTDMSALAISQDVGYTNAGSFGRRFRQITGMSPMEYRRIKLLNKEENSDDSNNERG